MKLPLLSMMTIVITAILAVLIGYSPTETRWGSTGIACMFAAGVICVVSSLLAMAFLGVAANWFPGQLGQAALAATGVRLLLTMFLGAVYQVWAKPELTPFLLWALVFYGILLVIDTVFSVMMVQQQSRARVQGGAS